MNFIEIVGKSVAINSILVNENIRPAMLVQPADYREATHNDKETKKIVSAIKNEFPELIHSSTYDTYQGVIISKQNYDGNTISISDMGKILGYPCYNDFNSLDVNRTRYAIHLNIVFSDNTSAECMVNICNNKSKLNDFNEIKNKINELKNSDKMKKYSHLLGDIKITDVKIETDKIVSAQSIINKLIKNKKLDNDDIDVISNIIFNIGGDFDTQMNILDNIQYDNSIHNGILLNIINTYTNDTLSPFYPLQNYHSQQAEIEEITNNSLNQLLDIIKKTKNKTCGNNQSKKNKN